MMGDSFGSNQNRGKQFIGELFELWVLLFPEFMFFQARSVMLKEEERNKKS